MKKNIIILLVAALTVTVLGIKKQELTVDIENPIGCYIKALPSQTKINECSAALLKKQAERIDDLKVK
ncbi:hypothetical protein [Terrisporobacter petrolearius]|uniref:hypothetical protein n=1 Tax=Terrisporobacter petrolearius TaxID=1460447 RepID=UPI0031CC8F92